jgi:ABC-2 type transport system permease protein
MLEDIGTIIWKEWKDEIWRQGQISQRPTQMRIILMLLLFGIIIPWRAGPSYVENPMSLVVPTLIPIFAIIGIVTDSFAGERERHTLETLLASRLSDQSILVGKMLCAVLAAWAAFIIMLALGLIGLNIAHGHGQLLMFSRNRLITALVFNVLLSLVVSSAGVLVSLRAPTVRDAMKMLSIGFMIIIYGGAFGFQMLPPDWRASIIKFVTGENLFTLEALAAAILLAIAAALFAVARLRFQRARLILD